MSDIVDRKAEHIRLAKEEGSQGRHDYWDKYDLPVRSLPEMNLDEVDTGVQLFGKRINQPLIVASMTGGSIYAEKINTNLAKAVEFKGVAMGVGSQRVALEKDEARRSFEMVRKHAPNAVIFANMGVVQLNYGHGVDSYQRIVDMVKADALYLHINPMQEILQPNGDIKWADLIPKIEKLVNKISVPVWVKEVGSGLDIQTVRSLVEIGVSGVDVAGVGGTSWTWIEGMRSQNPNLTEWFKDWGIKTDQSLIEIQKMRKKFSKEISLVASGGIRNPIHGLKSHMLGADLYSSARPFLDAAIESSEKVVDVLSDWEDGLRFAMFGCGIKKWK